MAGGAADVAAAPLYATEGTSWRARHRNRRGRPRWRILLRPVEALCCKLQVQQQGHLGDVAVPTAFVVVSNYKARMKRPAL